MNTLTVITSEGVKKFHVKQSDHEKIVDVINMTPYTTEELVSLVAPKVVE